MDTMTNTTESQELRNRLRDIKQDITETARLGRDYTVRRTREWTSTHEAATVGIIAGFGVFFGFLLGARAARR